MAIQLEHNKISQTGSPYFIAEIGLNHNGDLGLAKQMVEDAASSGAHAAKFQLYNSDYFINKNAKLADSAPGSLQDFFKKFELSKKDWQNLREFTFKSGLDFFCSVFDRPSLEFYKTLDIKIIKVSSCDLTNVLLLQDIQDVLPNISVIVSTGTCDENEIEKFMKITNFSNLIILQCVSSYPAEPADYNLNTIPLWRKKYKVLTGLSDHCVGNDTAIAATAIGACVIEKHFTSDTNLDGPDQKLSLDPSGFRNLVDRCNLVHESLGDGKKISTESERLPREFGRRNLYASCLIANKTKINKNHIIAQRPGNSKSSCNEPEKILNKKALKDIPENSLLSLEDFK